MILLMKTVNITSDIKCMMSLVKTFDFICEIIGMISLRHQKHNAINYSKLKGMLSMKVRCQSYHL